MQHSHAILVARHERRVREAARERNALRQFVDAVAAFEDDPGPGNLERYLAASRSLGEPSQAEPAKAA
jgi:hypothetical protein